MAQAGLLLPSEPLFIVDKSWGLQGNTKRASRGNSDLFTRDTFKVSKATYAGTSTPKQTFSPDYHAVLSKAIGAKDGLHFIAANEPGGRQDTNARKAVRKHARQYVSHQQSKNTKERSSTSPRASVSAPTPRIPDEPPKDVQEQEPESSIQPVISTSSHPLYGNEHARNPTGLEEYLYYYRHVISQSAYPLERYMNFEVNPVRGTCFPLALSDRLFLQTIMLISAIHSSHINGTDESDRTDALARRVLKELRSRIAQKDVSDATLLSVSCIALLENLLGHHKQWRVHASGLNEMLRVRGGVEKIDTSIRWKIYRADLVGAVDHVSKPMLPHPGIRTNLKDIKLHSKGSHLSSFVASLTGVDMDKHLRAIFEHIHHVTHVIQCSIVSGTPLSAYFYDNSCMQIQHDLLEKATDNDLDESWRLAGLVYMTTFTKMRPFNAANCIVLSSKLRQSLSKAIRMLTSKKHHLWLAFIGGLTSTNTSDHEWFLEILVHIVRACDCTTWAEAKELLQQVLWLDILHDAHGLQLWEEISNAMPRSNYSLGSDAAIEF